MFHYIFSFLCFYKAIVPLHVCKAFRGWKKANPQMQPKESICGFQGWKTASPFMQPRDSEAFQGWLKTFRESSSKQSVGLHAWSRPRQKKKESGKDVRQQWLGQNPVVCTSRTGPDAKRRPGREWGERVGAIIGKRRTPFQRGSPIPGLRLRSLPVIVFRCSLSSPSRCHDVPLSLASRGLCSSLVYSIGILRCLVDLGKWPCILCIRFLLTSPIS